MTIGSCNKKRKRDCSTEESTGSNYSPNQFPSQMKLPIDWYIRLVKELNLARYMQNPYENQELTWEDNELWKMVIRHAKVKNVSVELLRAAVKELHENLIAGASTSYEMVQIDELRELVLRLFAPDRGPPKERDIVQETNKRNRKCESGRGSPIGQLMEDRGAPIGQLMEFACGQSTVTTTTFAHCYSQTPIPVTIVPAGAGGESQYLSTIENACSSLGLNSDQCFKVESYFSKKGAIKMYSGLSAEEMVPRIRNFLSSLLGEEQTKGIHPQP